MTKTLITNPSGADFWGCECLAQWWPAVNTEAVRRGIVRQQIDVTQGCYNRGGVAASAGTHDGGGVLDLAQTSGALVRLLREAGAAAWHRTPAQGFPHHIHMVLVGCPHLSSGAAHQIAEYRAGRNGLAGRGGDDGPRVTIRTWRDGPTRITPKTAVTTSTTGDLPMDQNTFNKLMLNALKNREVAVALGRAALGNTYGGDRDGDKRPDTAGQIIGINTAQLDRVETKLDKLLGGKR